MHGLLWFTIHQRHSTIMEKNFPALSTVSSRKILDKCGRTANSTALPRGDALNFLLQWGYQWKWPFWSELPHCDCSLFKNQTTGLGNGSPVRNGDARDMAQWGHNKRPLTKESCTQTWKQRMSWACCFPFKMISQQMSWNAHPHNQSQCPCHMKTDLNCIIAISSYLMREPFDLIIFLLFFGFKSLGSEVTCRTSPVNTRAAFGLRSSPAGPQLWSLCICQEFAERSQRSRSKLSGLRCTNEFTPGLLLLEVNAKIRFNFNLISTVCVALGT